MNKELQDKAWSVLPKEFKEEVKKYYAHYRCALNTHEAIINHIFGLHNLTSDEEGEEALMCDRYTVCMLYDRTDSVKVRQTLESLFGSKCLPDNVDNLAYLEPKANSEFTPIPEKAFVSQWDKTEPKFKVGDKVKIAKNGNVYNNSIGEIIDISSNGSAYIPFCNGQAWFRLTDLEPYTEPEEKSRKKSQEIANCDKHFDNILKDSSRNERRLNIATQIMSSILSNQMMLNNLAHGETTADGVVKCIVNASRMYTDALIAECEQTEKQKGN